MELRLYSFVNFYLSSIQQGIQTGHAAVRLIREYGGNDDSHMALDWADNHETFIILNGGDDAAINSAYDVVKSSGFPYHDFIESARSLNNLRTCVAVVLPETVFNAQRDTMMSKVNNVQCYLWEGLDEKGQPVLITYTPAHPHYALVDLIRNCRLAS